MTKETPLLQSISAQLQSTLNSGEDATLATLSLQVFECLGEQVKLGPRDFLAKVSIADNSDNTIDVHYTMLHKRLLLAFQIPADKDDIKESVCIVAGVLACEYTSFDIDEKPLLHTLYISRIDTTGLLNPRHHQRPLVQCLLKGYISDIRTRSQCAVRVHVLALSNPEYMFPLSHQLTHLKHSVSGPNLIWWWMKALDFAFANCDTKECKKYALVPGLDDFPREVRLDTSWILGELPFHKKCNARDFFPIVSSDAASECLQRSLDSETSSVSIETFTGMLSNSSDFQRGRAGILIVELPAVATDATMNSICDSSPTAVFDTILALMGIGESAQNVLTYETIAKAKESSQLLIDALKNAPALKISLRVKSSMDTKALNHATEKREAPTVNVLTVKRRRKSPN